MKFENTKVFGMENALIGMRLPMCVDFNEAKQKGCINEHNLDIGQKLINADNRCGQPNSKFLRMVHVQVAVTAPLYWWKEFDTYKVGTVANSTSTMHKLASTPITIDCFEMDDFSNIDCFSELSTKYMWINVIGWCEQLRQRFNETKDKRYWKELIRLLPESWLQTRMLDLNYATLRNIYAYRHNHKLTEWHTFCDFIEGLPYAEELLIS